MSTGLNRWEVAAVTGAARGIGFSIARRMAEKGLRVALLDSNAVALDDAIGRLSHLGYHVDAVACDVARLDSVDSAFREIAKALGTPEILVNNAGMTLNERFIESLPQAWEQQIAVNYVGVLNCTYVALPGMISNGAGRIVCIGSDAGRVGTPRQAVYAGSKAAVIGFAKSLAAEVAKHQITVNVISPGSTDTPLFRSALTQQQIDRRIGANPLGRLGTPDDVAGAVAFLVSDDASYVTGQVLSVNGGSSRVD